MVEFGGFLPLFHVFADSRNFNNDVLFIDILGNTESALDIALFYRGSGNAAIALRIMLFNVDFFIVGNFLGE